MREMPLSGGSLYFCRTQARKGHSVKRTAQCYQDRDTGKECSRILEFAMDRYERHARATRTLRTARRWMRRPQQIGSQSRLDARAVFASGLLSLLLAVRLRTAFAEGLVERVGFEPDMTVAVQTRVWLRRDGWLATLPVRMLAMRRRPIGVAAPLDSGGGRV